MNKHEKGAAVRTIPAVCALLVLVVVGLVLATGLASGYRAHRIATPSMATTAPVGSLVVTRPANVETGDVVTFVPPGKHSLYTHRIVSGNVADGFQTKGDLNGAPDPWTITQADVQGKVVATYRGLGYVAQAIPVIIGGLALTWMLGRWVVTGYWRRTARILGVSVTAVVAAVVTKPWNGIAMVAYAPGETGEGLMATVVSTGLLPVKVQAVGGESAVLHPGEHARLTTLVHDAQNYYHFTPSLHLGLLGWTLMVALCLLPTTVALLGVHRNGPGGGGNGPRRGLGPGLFRGLAGVTRRSARFAGGSAAVLAVMGVCVSLIVTQAQSSVTAQITNPKNSKATRAFYTCYSALRTPQSAYPDDPRTPISSVFAYALNSASTTQPDYSGNNVGAAWSAAPNLSANNYNDAGCKRDNELVGTSSYNPTNVNPRSTVTNGNRCLDPTSATKSTVPTSMAVSAWFKTSVASNGRIIGLADVRGTAQETTSSRQLYMDPSGRLVFQAGSGVIASAANTSLADGNWHVVVVNYSSTRMNMYVDGKVQSSGSPTFSPANNTGYWRIACSTGSTRPSVPTASGGTMSLPNYFNGQLDHVVLYSQVLSPDNQVEILRSGTY